MPALTAYGVSAQDIPVIVEKSLVASSTKANPIVLTAEEMGEILQEALQQWYATCRVSDAGRGAAIEAFVDEHNPDGLPIAGRAGEGYVPIANHSAAIIFAVNMARPGKLVIVTGKGHEQSMCFGTTEYPWDDHVAMRAAMRGRALATDSKHG